MGTHSLSALSPVKFTYKFNKEEKLTGNLVTYNNGCSYYTHGALQSAQDVALSKKNLLVITNNMPLKEIFNTDSSEISIGTIPLTLYLKTPANQYVKYINKNIYAGGIGDFLQISVVPIANKIVELVIDKTKKIIIDELYPYTARISEDILTEDKINRQRFEVDYKDNKISFKTKTKEGYRFLSYGADKTIRAVGLMLNETVVNPYLFTAEFVCDSEIFYDFNARTSEVKYFNDLGSFINQKNLNIKEEKESNPHLLISCTTQDISLSGEVPINIALLKSNFSSSGTFSTKQTT